MNSDARRKGKFIKRLFDIAVSAALLLVCSPILLAVSLLILLTMGPPILFRQLRPGLHGEPFTILKFRTMRDPAPGDTVSNDGSRITKLGGFLRKSSLDELPELLNVLKGDMSLVGPRPLRVEYLEYYTEEEQHRHDVLPGITGLAQVSGRNALSWEEKFSLDLEYVRNQSFWLDLKILARTITAVLGRRGITHEGSATMPSLSKLRGGKDLRA